MRSTTLKVLDAAVIVGSLAVGFGAVKTVMVGVKTKSLTIGTLGVLTGLIALYAAKEAMHKIQE